MALGPKPSRQKPKGAAEIPGTGNVEPSEDSPDREALADFRV